MATCHTRFQDFQLLIPMQSDSHLIFSLGNLFNDINVMSYSILWAKIWGQNLRICSHYLYKMHSSTHIAVALAYFVQKHFMCPLNMLQNVNIDVIKCRNRFFMRNKWFFISSLFKAIKSNHSPFNWMSKANLHS